MLELKPIRSASRYLVEIPSVSINARGPCRLVASNQRLTWNHGDVSCGHWYIVAGCDEVFRAEMAVSECNTWKFGDDVICVSDSVVASWLSGDVVGSGLFSDLRSTVSVL